MSTNKPDEDAFSTRIKQLIDKHFNGSLQAAAQCLGVHPATLKNWVKGVKTPGYQHQVNTLRKLRSL